MCTEACLAFGRQSLPYAEIEGKDVLEVGAMDVNGSLRGSIEPLGPRSYLGTDIASGPGVDAVCPVGGLVAAYGRERFDVVVCTEVLEHVRDWRSAVSNLKNVLRPGGVLLVTTRSKGFPYHGYPHDFWRYELEDFRTLFSDLDIEALEADPTMPGVFLKARKPRPFRERLLDAHELHSVVTRRRCRRIAWHSQALLRLRRWLRSRVSSALPPGAKALVRKVYPRVSVTWRD